MSKPTESKPRGKTPPAARHKPMWRPSVMLLSLGMLTGAAVFSVWARANALRLGYELSKADAEQHQLVRDNNKLRSEVAALRSPARLERIAVDQLGLAAPDPSQVLRLGADGPARLAGGGAP